jgi:hypothetical protein
MATSPVPATESQACISPVGRILGMFFSPKATFEDIVRKPSWMLPLILMIAFGIAATVGLNQKMNWREYVSQQIEKSSKASQLSPEQKQQQIEVGAKFAPITTYVFGIPIPVIVVLLVSLVMMGAYSILGGASTNYKTALAIVAHAYAPSYIGSLLFLLVLFLKPPGSFDLNNPVATNIAAFLPEDTPKWLEALAKNVDVFSTWILILTAIGFGVSHPKKLKGGKTFTIAFSVLAVYIVIRVGLAFVFS